jgi:hypothetical protein
MTKHEAWESIVSRWFVVNPDGVAWKVSVHKSREGARRAKRLCPGSVIVRLSPFTQVTVVR